MAKRTRTAMAAAAGTAMSRPTKPNKAPNANSANISQTGCRPTLLPTSLGDRMLPSMNWPMKNTAATATIIVQSGQNCTMATPMANTSPVSEPT